MPERAHLIWLVNRRDTFAKTAKCANSLTIADFFLKTLCS
ncbi:hypothetical protein ECEC1846_0416 [Escherichia coli EC1846]|uniref:Uncharacterized protein n=2 Tax=Escherichia coli TaxID=562 RepID=A0A0H3PS86_ECO5C|nr:hypothetical protein ECH74115_0439 [Escherichia coli O157:H7 str. EC4115]AHG13032.1 hypothetical protein ECRM13516_0344 [Escherichia coli O145:H28 str. RM13516]AHY63373.1 hypothetical protein ECRM12761_1680 [Escherichia coli O145:H28 str. RM12761]AJA24343.1 hypothetical protein SS52_0436 [Escherichia coli O157:H7 str. SS52]EDU32118.1 hypothetical protein ECH7EC4196_1578 [Escherichia coli O157:H7 str. EC4196]EDU53974.1 hypothetical protein ECH7EC4113_0316 [Escherichia coli O157:H7 str. EC411